MKNDNSTNNPTRQINPDKTALQGAWVLRSNMLQQILLPEERQQPFADRYQKPQRTRQRSWIPWPHF
jgi:hypothetical protein